MSVAFLKGYRALDLTGLSGQLCGRMLGDLGMEVIKIEPPGGDPVRNLAPFVKSADGKQLSTTFAHLNAGKASKVLDLDKEADRAAFRKLVETADVVIESFQPGELDSQRARLQRSRGDQSGHCDGVDHRLSARPGRRKISRATISSRLARERIFIYLPAIRRWRRAGRRRPRPIISRACSPPRACSPRFTGASAPAKAITSTRRCRKLWRPRSISFACGPMRSRFSKRAGSQHGSVAPAKIFPCRDGFVYLYVTRQHWKLFLDHLERSCRRVRCAGLAQQSSTAAPTPMSSIRRSKLISANSPWPRSPSCCRRKAFPACR